MHYRIKDRRQPSSPDSPGQFANRRTWHCIAIAAAISALSVFSFPAGAADAPGSVSLHIDYSENPDADELLAYDVSIVSPASSIDPGPAQALGNRVFGYMSVVEVASDAPYRERAENLGVAFPATNEKWNSRIADLRNPRWQQFVIDELAAQIAELGYDGFFLDTVDSFSLLPNAESQRQSLIALINELHERFPEKQIIINRGFDVLADTHAALDAVLIESVFRSYDFESREYVAVDAATTALLEKQIVSIREMELPVFVVDYLPTDDNSTNLADVTFRRLRDLGCHPLISTPDLNGEMTGALGRVARRILVLHGHDTQKGERPRIWPADTTTHSILQMPLEWIGYEVEYHDVSLGAPTADTAAGSEWAGVIVDDEIEIPPLQEEACARWLLARHAEGKKLLFVGDYPIHDDILRGLLFDALGIHAGDPELASGPLKNGRITLSDPAVMNFEVDAKVDLREFQNIRAPDGGRVMLSLAAETAIDATLNFDPVYTADWGGCLLAPYVSFEASEETVLTFVDPFEFLGSIFPTGNFPAPDPSTRDGVRAFYTHIDGDGFTSLTSVEEGKLCGELLYDRFLSKQPFPITVSIVESEIRAHMLLQDPAQQSRYEAAARRIFELPNVEPASHSYSHPYVWFNSDVSNTELYSSSNVDLKLTARYPDIVTSREIAGSINYIDEQLSPKGKPSKMMLWSGNCRPGVEALQEVAALGIESMNGGNTILSKRFPGLSAVAPRTNYWDGHLQVYASNQNEFMYTNGWTGPYYGGFRQVIETFEMTESPRRLKPVNVYYHFYSVERPDAMQALTDIFDWCLDQPLHSLTASQFAALTRDSHQTKIFRTAPRRWTALNEGHLRTYRLPVELGVPDIAACTGVTGYSRHEKWHFIHTDGSEKSVIALADRPAPFLHLRSSSGEISFTHRNEKDTGFRVHDFRPVHVELAGIRTGARVLIDVNGERHSANAGKNGSVRIKLPAEAEVKVAVID